ncbi:hypothetical protein [Variovorax sp. JS1663]|uniref:hypothetical protein n=1 Tax=Variovorax sp. JS1663 TaxID=1851577 RepID=UPI000B347BFA|nr:hypothetical protein [Variovorax sp. JS1663]OUM01760.1 hypothetical protein A8M77_14455 [Variovorax sp. JS1663]
MAVVLSVTSRQYSPRKISLAPSLPQRSTLRITLTRENWPPGDVGSITLISPDGDLLASASFQGGAATNRDGTPRTTQVLHLPDVPAGQCGVDVDILQTLRTAVIIERL